jgi:hypothetical protein
MFLKPKIENSKAGSPQGKDTNVIVFDFAKVSKWPVRDEGKVKMLGNIEFLKGSYVQEIYATSSSISTPKSSEGDEDNVGFTGTPEFSHPGSSLDIEEFIAYATNKQLGVAFRLGGCDGGEQYYKVFGTPCNPLRLLVEGQDDKEGVKDLMKFEQSRKADLLPGRYYGTWQKASAFPVDADSATVDLDFGTGEYQLSDNTTALIITDLINSVNNHVYTLIGSGGSNPATIESSNTKFLLKGGVDWQGLSNSRITLKAFDNGSETVFVEQSRS